MTEREAREMIEQAGKDLGIEFADHGWQWLGPEFKGTRPPTMICTMALFPGLNFYIDFDSEWEQRGSVKVQLDAARREGLKTITENLGL